MADITLLDIVKIAYTWAPILMNVIMIIFWHTTITCCNQAVAVAKTLRGCNLTLYSFVQPFL